MAVVEKKVKIDMYDCGCYWDGCSFKIQIISIISFYIKYKLKLLCSLGS